MFYINSILGYYEGDKINSLDVETLQRPSLIHDWIDGIWILNTAKKSIRDTEKAQQLADKSAIDFAKAEPVIQYLVNHTPQECADYVAGVLVGLPAPVIELQQQYAMALCVLAKGSLR